MSKRSDADYEIEALSKGLMILEALEGVAFEPVTIGTIMSRTGFTRDACFRTLKTFSLRGYAVCEKNKWTVGKRLIRISQQVVRHKV